MKLLKFSYALGIAGVLLFVSNSGLNAQEKEVDGDNRNKKVSVERKSDKTPTQEEIDREAGIVPEEKTNNENTLNAEQVKDKYNKEGNPYEEESRTDSDAPTDDGNSVKDSEVKISPKRDGEVKFKTVPGEVDDIRVE